MLQLPVRMSRTFTTDQLVEGRIYAGFYHDGIQVADGQSQLVNATGRTVIQSGITLGFAANAILDAPPWCVLPQIGGDLARTLARAEREARSPNLSVWTSWVRWPPGFPFSWMPWMLGAPPRLFLFSGGTCKVRIWLSPSETCRSRRMVGR